MKKKNGLHIDENGTKRYYLNDELHRVNGPAIEDEDGSKLWLLHGELHRVNGPAIEDEDGSTVWYLNGKKHREDGPAVQYAIGPTVWWWLNGKELIHPEEFKNMQAFFKHLNDNEEYSLQWINDFNGIINMIKNPSGKQTRLHAMRWKI